MKSRMFILILSYFVQGISTQCIDKNIQNVQVIRLIDITTYIVKSKYKITFQNIGKTPVSKYLFELEDVEAFTSFIDMDNETLLYDAEYKKNETTYSVHLNKLLLPKEEYKLKINVIYPTKLVPTTKFSRYDEEHSFMWRGNGLFYSRYFTLSYRYMFVTDVVFNKNIQTSLMYDSSVNNLLIYYELKINPFSRKENILTFTSPLPVFRVKKLERSIFVSQFGKIMVEDQVVVKNAGPKLLGPYFNTESDYWMYTHLPSFAENINVFDSIGNNSKTFLREHEGKKTLKFIPRYSLRQGGWKSSYTLQYFVPIYEYVYRDNSEYNLKIRALDHVLNDVVVEDAQVRIVLPDGASVLTVVIPLGFEKENTTNIYTSLSVFGRKSVNLKGKMLIEEHMNDVIITYDYSLLNFFSAPFFVMLLLESVFIMVILWRKYSENFCL